MKRKQKTSGKMGIGKKIALISMILVTVLIVAGAIIYCLMPGKSEFTEGNNIFSDRFSEQYIQGDMISAYGITGIGTIQVEFSITNLENNLIIEEVYVASGESITADMPILKLTEESIEAVKAELEEDLKAADLAYRAGKIEYEQSKITAYYDKETTILEGSQADAVYAESISGLSDNAENAKKELEEAKAQIAAYETALAANSFYEDYQVEYYKKIYDENLELLKAKMEEWQVSWSEVTSGASGGISGGNTGGIPGGSTGGFSDMGGQPSIRANMDLHSQYVQVLSSFYNVLEQNLADYEQALADYEAAVADTRFNLQTLKLELSSLEQSYAQAMESYENSLYQAELTRQTSVSNAEKAENNYEANVEKAEADYETLKSAKEEAEENITRFNTLVKNGYLYASETGRILRMNLRIGGRISSEGQLYTLRDTEKMTITVSVDQSNIAVLNVGDTAIVQSEENGIYNGVISAINPISSSDSKTNITYSVTVKMTGKYDSLSENETVVVYFGMEG